MGDDKSKPKPTPAAVCTPPLQRADFFATDCKSALLFPDSAPLADLAKAHQCVPRKGKHHTPLDLQALWAHVRMKSANDTPAVLVFLHGFYGYVTIDAAGKTATPDWATTAFGKPGGLCTPLGYETAKSADAYTGSIIAIVPEIAWPGWFDKDMNHHPSFPGSNAAVQAGTLGHAAKSTLPKDTAALGNLLDECLRRLNGLRNSTCPGPALSQELKSTGIKRLFLSGHSGAHHALYPSATSTLALNRPTDLILLDCFYADGRDQVGAFAKAMEKKANEGKGGIGMGADQSRIIAVWNTKSYRSDKLSEAMSSRLRDTFKGQFMRVNGDENAARKALEKVPVVAVKTDVGHFSIPAKFLPVVLQTGGASPAKP